MRALVVAHSGHPWYYFDVLSVMSLYLSGVERQSSHSANVYIFLSRCINLPMRDSFNFPSPHQCGTVRQAGLTRCTNCIAAHHPRHSGRRRDAGCLCWRLPRSLPRSPR